MGTMGKAGHTEKERLILQAAMDEFSQKGVYGARMASIAERAGVNKALLHYYFRSKDQLYFKVLEIIALPLGEILKAEVKKLDPDDLHGLVRLIATTIVQSAIAMPHSSILLSEFASGGAYIKQMNLSDALSHFETSVLAFLDRLQESKKIKPFKSINILVAILGMCWNIFLCEPFSEYFVEKKGGVRDEQFYNENIELIVEMTASGLLLSPNH